MAIYIALIDPVETIYGAFDPRFSGSVPPPAGTVFLATRGTFGGRFQIRPRGSEGYAVDYAQIVAFGFRVVATENFAGETHVYVAGEKYDSVLPALLAAAQQTGPPCVFFKLPPELSYDASTILRWSPGLKAQE